MHRVPRWHSGVVAAIALVATGVLFGSAALLLAAVVPVSYLGYAALSSVPDPDAVLTIQRDCTPRTPLPGERVEVTLTVRNEGERTLPDVRLVDGVPPELDVVDSSAQTATTLRPGEDTELTYTLRPRRGSYTFEGCWVRLRSLSATAVATGSVDATGEAVLECSVPLDGVPIHRETIPFVGAVASDSGGAGYEFHSTREYQQGDPLSRIDWRRYARTGELGTVRYREQESAKIVLVLDGRPESAVAAAEGHPDGVTLSAYAGVVSTAALTEENHSVGVVGLGVRAETPGVYTGPPAYVEPGTGADVGGRIARVCDTVAAQGAGGRVSARESEAGGTGTDPEAGTGPQAQGRGQRQARADGYGAAARSATVGGTAAPGGPTSTSGRSPTQVADHLATLLPSDAQLVVCTPAVDDEIVDLAAALRRRGYRLSVVSPDVTTRDEIGARLAAVRRNARLEHLRRTDIPVADWDPEQPLTAALGRAFDEVIR
ncbi:DUF11/DUF58 family protein [Natrialba magadii ATCC 43099]|uniref:DUF11/DUF58 family protein n=1 Tax=Natrialba magadii (strain ATCC 43099 / DSM 3394 / CCM 3739 / CIP 104546 / IAM 13178 / JCM 8861 / NBRC 102185 / NCIMB 2190 / MS3) TaxID=547559 RepID=D3SUK9_NATMM|nr:DUF58 domain-containing protein [Natrialba magadii]ADD05267.1 DUF11/DUF58 family protein [Natrialba magadii ATCC 43099]ELY29011.1 hypothetical protein C500_11900 [Natrialba magadii ATCC 43099]